MNGNVIFETSRIYQYPINNDWVIEGRSYKDIYVGDEFSVKEDKKIILKLVSIMTYGKVIDFLCSNMTGALYIKTDYNLLDKKIKRLNMHQPSFESRNRTCIEVLERSINGLSEDIKLKIKAINQTEFFSEFMQFSYRYTTVKNIQELIKKY